MGEVEYMHKSLAAGRWEEMSFAKQMANIGSEVSRGIRWKTKGNPERMEACVDRALELIDLTIISCQKNNTKARMKELLRSRDELCDYFYDYHEYDTDGESIQKYYDAFAYVE